MDDFATAFHDADSLILVDIYPASEPPIEGVTSEALAKRIRAAGHPSVRFAPSFPEAAELCSVTAAQGDLIVTLGAGNVYQLGPMILERLQAKQAVPAQ
jgi:UDP-N-acetylmuramate--alanine ligase